MLGLTPQLPTQVFFANGKSSAAEANSVYSDTFSASASTMTMSNGRMNLSNRSYELITAESLDTIKEKTNDSETALWEETSSRSQL